MNEPTATDGRTYWQTVLRRFLRHRPAVVGLAVLLLIAAFAYLGPHLWKWDHRYSPDIPSWAPPTGDHPFGTSQKGHDMLGATMRATQISLNVAFTVAVGSTVLGALAGAAAGYFRGWVDAVVMRAVDVLFILPFIAVVAVVSGNLRTGSSWWAIALVLLAFSWMFTARAVRAETLSLREKDFVESARATGCGDWRIIRTHILPNTAGTVIVSVTLQIAFAILAETTLSFLGIGIQPPDTSLGRLIEDAGESAFNEHWYLFYIPGLIIIAIALTVNFIGDGIRDAMDPHQTLVRR
ncbi:ABC transporter permease [Salininema proteolyticum]|uniref:ABC transporter permease n=1 Tax=Salininema proteolyticum TaxID=1607685 RepID=A0ABV8U1E4_9ACTN